MTKKDYQLIARTIRAVYKASITDDERKGVKAVAFALARSWRTRAIASTPTNSFSPVQE